jgi:cysteinyl-tRNA synthetase
MKLRNSLNGQITNLPEGALSIYACGITPYSDAHIGHARTYVIFDLLQRVLQHQGRDVRLVRNITDIDDKIIKASKEANATWQEWSNLFANKNRQLMVRTGITIPEEPKATEYIPETIWLIQQLQEKGLAYVGADGSVYYDVSEYKGDLSLMPHQEGALRSEQGQSRVDVSAKEDSRDFVLWKRVSDEEPGFHTELGYGRPGWHIECSAMIHALFNGSVSIHGGGVDLKFPHHMAEIMQSEPVSGKPLADIWMHNGSVLSDGVKMSKSLGNYVTWEDALTQASSLTHSPEAAGSLLYFTMLQTHWQKPYDWKPTLLLDNYKVLLEWAALTVNVSAKEDPEVLQYLNDNLNTPGLIVYLRALAVKKNQDKLAKLKWALHILNVNVQAIWEGYQTYLAQDPVKSLIALRNEARARKDWATADNLRTELIQRGVIVQDN